MTHKPVCFFLKGNNPISLPVNNGVQGGATSFILSCSILRSLFAGILISENIMRKTDLKIGMTLQKLEWLASLCQYDIACLIYFFLILQTLNLSTAILVHQGLKNVLELKIDQR